MLKWRKGYLGHYRGHFIGSQVWKKLNECDALLKHIRQKEKKNIENINCFYSLYSDAVHDIHLYLATQIIFFM